MAECITKRHKLGKGVPKKAEPRDECTAFLPEYVKEPVSESLIEKRFSMIFRKSSAGISLASRDGRFVEVNPAFCRFLGYTEHELLEQLTCEKVIHPDDHELLRSLWDNAKAGSGSANSIEERYLHRDGSILWGQVSRDWFYDRQGKPLYLLTIMQDISTRKRIDA
jgi:PAS domain S-box-containing protein